MQLSFTIFSHNFKVAPWCYVYLLSSAALRKALPITVGKKKQTAAIFHSFLV
jgi:hypothetical protein